MCLLAVKLGVDTTCVVPIKLISVKIKTCARFVCGSDFESHPKRSSTWTNPFATMMMEDDDSPPNALKAFDAFPKVHQSYVHSRSSKGGIVSIAMFVLVTILFWTELVTWWRGTEVMKVSVEKGVGHGMQLNVDITVAMACEGIYL